MMLTKKDAIRRLFLRLSLFLPLLLLFGVAQSPAASAETATAACASGLFDETAIIHHIHDGDTLTLVDGRKIRLIGINTPELAQGNKPAEPYARAATHTLKSLFEKDKTIKLLHGKDKKDHYGRTLAHALLPDGQNVQAILLKQGLARVITVPPNTRFAPCYLEMERQARCGKTGLWQDTDIVEAKSLDSNHTGFQLVQGRVESIRKNDKGIWLDLDNKLTIGIRPENQALFDVKAIDTLLHQTVIIRGWVNSSNKTTPYYVRIRHPLAIQPANTYSCH